MNIKITVITLLFIMLSACSTQPIQPIDKMPADAVDSERSVKPVPTKNKAMLAGLTRIKAGKILKLVRIMEGGGCNEKQQGAIGMFKLYASSEDIVRIKQQQGRDVFANFERLIEQLSMRALQQAVDSMDFKSDINTKNKNLAQQQLLNRLDQLFINSIRNDITQFEAETTLTIDVIIEPDSMIIYQNNCEIPHRH